MGVFQNCSGFNNDLELSSNQTEETEPVIVKDGQARLGKLGESTFNISFPNINEVNQEFYGVDVPTKYLVSFPQVQGGRGELVQRYLSTSHPSYSSKQLSKNGLIDPRMACPDDLVADGQSPRAQFSADFSDIAPRALIASQDQKKTFLIFGGHINPFNMVGGSLRLVKRDCSAPIYKSAAKPGYADFRSFEWISNVYTRNGQTIYAFANNDWRACPELNNPAGSGCTDAQDGYTKNENNWWWAAFTSLVSTNGGQSFRSPSTNPTDYVVARPSNSEFQRVVKHSKYFNPKGITGFYQSTNILRSPIDGSYYFITRRQEKAELIDNEYVSKKGLCVLRAVHASDLKDPKAWRSLSSIDELGVARFEGNPVAGECHLIDPIFTNESSVQVKLSELRHLSYNTYLKKFIGLGIARVPKENGRIASSVVLITTSDPTLATWDSQFTEVVEGRYCSSGPCPSSLTQLSVGTRVLEIKYPNLIDPKYEHLVAGSDFKLLVSENQGSAMAIQDGKERRNFDVTGQTPWLYFSFKEGTVTSTGVKMHGLEIVRVPIQITLK